MRRKGASAPVKAGEDVTEAATTGYKVDGEIETAVYHKEKVGDLNHDGDYL